MMRQTAQIHQGGQYMSFHGLPVDEVKKVKIKGVKTKIDTHEASELGKYFTVATIQIRFNQSLHTSEIKLFTSHYEKH